MILNASRTSVRKRGARSVTGALRFMDFTSPDYLPPILSLYPRTPAWGFTSDLTNRLTRFMPTGFEWCLPLHWLPLAQSVLLLRAPACTARAVVHRVFFLFDSTSCCTNSYHWCNFSLRIGIDHSP